MQSRAGVSQVLNRYTFASTLSHLRRCNTPIGRDGKIAKPRQLHNTHWGMVCPAETPEGQACGLVKNLSLMTNISVGSPSAPIIEFLEEWGMENLEELTASNIQDATKVFVNGVWAGVHRDPSSLVNTLKRLRRNLDINPEVSIVKDIREKELRMYTDAGRCLRPLFIVEDQRLLLRKEHVEELSRPAFINDEGVRDEPWTWNDLLSNGIVEYVDAEEEETILICMTPEDLAESRQVHHVQQPRDASGRLKGASANSLTTWTHCEVHPSMILGICASIIPFPDHNQVRMEAFFSHDGLLDTCTVDSPLPLTLLSSHHVTRISQPWVNRPWVSMSPIIRFAWIHLPTFCTILRNHSQPPDLWSTFASENCLPVRTLWSLFFVTLDTTKKIPLL